ncbi:MAG TPA: insulinase family protein [Alkalispirochaeta sp.]|nr:insulinase family protein [Alkalispirochaeta sp.]
MSPHSAYDHINSQDVPDYHGTGHIYRHRDSGAHVFHLANDDPENMFAFSFATYPEDSTGVAHILEHTVLSGSQRFPVKDPFLQLLKGSVNTFLNAMTYPDKTVYPAASPVARDLFNMMQVYGDAVFFPLLKPELFRQEGHRLQFAENGALERTGIVYNEMKGNYSSHDSIVGETCFQSLFPDTIYGLDSGGDPAVIPELSYEQFTEFHRRYYHPSNARIVVYGDIPSEEYLSFLHEQFLSRFERQDPISPPARQPRWSEPQRREATYPLEGVTDLSERSSVTLNWLLFPVTEARRVVDAAVLAEILLGHSGSPLSRALLESGLGQDLSPVLGLETDLAEAVFSVGLRGTEVHHEEAIQELILSTLRTLVTEGIHAEAVEGALRRVEFSNREIKGGPNGMRVMRRALRGWMYGADPYDGLQFDQHMAGLRADLGANPRFFEELIETLFLQNPHRSTVVVRPDPEQMAREAHREQEELEAIAERLTDEERRRIDGETRELEQMQATPDPPEELAKIPFLTLHDVPREIQTVPYERAALSGAGDLFLHRQFTNGILYMDLAFDFGRLSQREELLLNVLGAAFTELGLPDVPHYRLNDEIALKTGGITAFVSNQTRYGDRSRVRRLFVVRMRVLERTWREGADLFSRIMSSVDFSDTRRLEQLLDELVQEMQSAVIPSGHYFSGLRAAAELHELMAIEERLNGVTQLDALRRFVTEPATVATELRNLFLRLIDPRRVHVNLTGSDEVVDEAARWIPDLLSTMSRRYETGPDAAADATGLGEPAGIRIVPQHTWQEREYLMASAGVSYVALTMPAVDFDHPLAPAQDLLSHILRTGPLWEKIRMHGGAYGAFASSRTTEGLFSFGSYRDPNTVKTLEAYRAALAELAEHQIDETQVDLAKVSVLGRELKPLTPRDSAFTNFRRRLHDIDDALRQETRNRLRAVTPADLQAIAAELGSRLDLGRAVILGGSSGLEEWSGGSNGQELEIPVYNVGV